MTDGRTCDTVESCGGRESVAAPVPLARVAARIKATGLAYILFEKPDLGLMARFLSDFGMIPVHEGRDSIYFRGTGDRPFIYSASRGDASRFLGIGVEAGKRDDLGTLHAAHPGSQIEPIDGPGGGERLRLRDPNGFVVDVVFGRRPAKPIVVESVLGPANYPELPNRVNRTQRPPLAPSPVARFGHVVIAAGRFRESADWLMSNLGMIPSDVQYVEDGRPALIFLRFDCGNQPTDHHSIVLLASPQSRYMHSAYETLDIDAIGQGAQVLRAAGWTHVWGIGRHILGSQIFDYWLDPYGHEVEHYADGDLLNASHPIGYSPLSKSGLWAWGDDMPESPSAAAGAAAATSEQSEEASLHAAVERALASPGRPWRG